MYLPCCCRPLYCAQTRKCIYRVAAAPCIVRTLATSYGSVPIADIVEFQRETAHTHPTVVQYVGPARFIPLTKAPKT